MGRRQFVFAALGLLAVVGCMPSSPLPDLEGREVTVAVSNDYPPFNYTDSQTGDGAGWDYDVIRELGRRLNFTPVFVTVPFAETIDDLAAGTYDMAGDGFSITYARAQRVDFSHAYMVLRQRLIKRAGDTRFDSLVAAKEDATLKLGAIGGSSNYNAAVNYFGADRVQSYVDVNPLIVALLAGDLDAVVLDDVVFDVQQEVRPGLLDSIPGVLYAEQMGFPFTKGSDLIGPINSALDAMAADGTLQAYCKKWIPVPEL